ncbi:hypothetical protein TNCV_563361 [Trichonephila clavipes]|nr:hypothetical protein TNCV_563361 [Trichonephila clavipes]
MILCVAELLERSKKSEKIQMLPGSSTSLTALFHGCGSHLKLLKCVVDGTGEVVLEVRRLQKTDISSYQQKEQAHHSSAGSKSVFAASGKQISKNCCQTFEGGGLYARRPVVCVPLTRQHRTARLQWCREHHNWTEQDWACVLFSDESRFSLSSDCRRQLIWREWYCLSSRKYPGKGPISDMQYHGVGRHHDQWPHAPTCGCEWDYDGPTIH